MKLIILGAGASKAYSHSSTGLRMPVAFDFFETFRKLPAYTNSWVLKDALWTYLYTVKGVDPEKYLSGGVDIEALHSEIEEVLLEKLSSGNRVDQVFASKPYNELTFIFASVINEIQNGPLSEAHVELANKLAASDSIITFNWDTLMDRALHSTGRWSIDSGYGFHPKSIFRNRWHAPCEYESGNCPPLLKLHGSSNWLTSYPMSDNGQLVPMQEASPDSVWVYEHSDGPYDCYAGRYMPGYAPFSYGYYPPNILDDRGKVAPEGHVIVRMRVKLPWIPEGTAGRSGLVSAPLIIPPVRKKRYDSYGNLFKELWNRAEDGIRNADHIIIIGYSFPRTDTRSRDMFVKALMRRKTIPLVSILDPSPEHVAETIKFDFGIPDSHVRVYKDYFTNNYDIDRLLCC